MAEANNSLGMNSQSLQLSVEIDGYRDLLVLDCDGTIGLSMLYEFTVNILAKQFIDDDQLLGKKVKLTWQMGPIKHTLAGIIYDWHINDDNIALQQYYSYSFTLVPTVRQLQHTKRICTYLNRSVPDIIRGMLQEQHIDFRFDLQKNYPEKNFVFQYQEDDWNFISRWLERLGIFYYFEMNHNQETLVITDANTTLRADPILHNLNYQNYRQNPPPTDETRLWQFSVQKQRAPKNLKVVAYDHNKASQQIATEIVVDPNGHGSVEVWQEDLLSPAEVKAYAETLKHIYLWQTQVFSGSVEQRLLPGTYVAIDSTYHSAWNKKNYLILACQYTASQRIAILASFNNVDPQPPEEARIFRCAFKAIPLNQTFCPKHTTPAPVISGVVPAFIVDASNNGIDIPINQQGCYQVALSAQPKALTYWLRMCQPYTGDGFGSMAPLHAGTEVMLSFLYGNPDLPIIINAVFNSTHQTIFNQANKSESGMISANKNKIIFNDQDNTITLLTSGKAKITLT